MGGGWVSKPILVISLKPKPRLINMVQQPEGESVRVSNSNAQSLPSLHLCTLALAWLQVLLLYSLASQHSRATVLQNVVVKADCVVFSNPTLDCNVYYWVCKIPVVLLVGVPLTDKNK